MTADSRHTALDARLKLLEIEAQVQRTALAAHLSQWEQRQPLAWLGAAARLAGQAMNTRSVRWLLIGAAIRLLRGRRHAQPGSPAPRP